MQTPRNDADKPRNGRTRASNHNGRAPQTVPTLRVIISGLSAFRNPWRESGGNKRVKNPRLALSAPHFAVGNPHGRGYQNTKAGGSANPGNGGAAASKIGSALACPPDAR